MDSKSFEGFCKDLKCPYNCDSFSSRLYKVRDEFFCTNSHGDLIICKFLDLNGNIYINNWRELLITSNLEDGYIVDELKIVCAKIKHKI